MKKNTYEKRAKIANSSELISESFKSDEALSILGNSIIDFCNEHAKESILHYNLDAIGYSRLIVNGFFPVCKVRLYFVQKPIPAI